MDDHGRKRLSEQWQKNEAELRRLADLPAGATDPAKREAEIDAEQDAIEYEIGPADDDDDDDLKARRTN